MLAYRANEMSRKWNVAQEKSRANDVNPLELTAPVMHFAI